MERVIKAHASGWSPMLSTAYTQLLSREPNNVSNWIPPVSAEEDKVSLVVQCHHLAAAELGVLGEQRRKQPERRSEPHIMPINMKHGMGSRHPFVFH